MSYAAIGNSPDPSTARTRGRRTGSRRPPRVTDPASDPCRVAVRSASCLPRGPHKASTSAAIIAASTCKPVPTAMASRPSRTSAAISLIATVTSSGNTGTIPVLVLVPAVFFW